MFVFLMLLFCFQYLQLSLDMMSLYIEENQIVLHLVVSNDDIVSRVGNLSDGDWYHVNIEFGQGFYVLQGKRIRLCYTWSLVMMTLSVVLVTLVMVTGTMLA